MPPLFVRDWDHKAPEEYRALQAVRLRDFLKHQVVPFSPFYRRLLGESCGLGGVRSLDDLERIPFTTKEMIAPTREEPMKAREFVLQPTAELIRSHWPLGKKLHLLWNRWIFGEAGMKERLAAEYRPVSAFFTTGRTALPTAFLLTRVDLEILEEVGRRIIQVARIDSADDRIVSLFPYAPHLAFWQVYYVGVGGAVFTLNTGGGKVLGTEAILQAIQKVRPSFLVGIPGYIYHVLREAHAAAMDLSFVKGLAVGGDQVTPGYRARVKELLGAMGAVKPRIQSVLGFTEARKCWTECPGEAEAGFHTYPDLEVIEVVDPETGKPAGEGQTGELVYTSLAGRGSCVVRYRTGDLIVGGMTLKPCPFCGRTVPRLASQLERVSNRKNFQLSKVKGTLVNLSVFKEELDNDPRVEEWQLVIKKKNDDPFEVDEMHLNLTLSARVPETESDAVTNEIDRKLFQISEVRLNSVRILPLKQILDLLGMETQLKEKRIVDLRSGQAAAPQEAVKR